MLQLMKRFDDALKIYDYGLKSLDPEDHGIEVRSLLAIGLPVPVTRPFC